MDNETIKETAIVPADANRLEQCLTTVSPGESLEEYQRRLDLLVDQGRAMLLAKVRFVRLALHATESADWTDLGGNPYLQGKGAERAARAAGMTIAPAEFVEETVEGERFVRCIQRVSWSLTGDDVVAEGERSTCDKFFKGGDSELRTAYNQALTQCAGREVVAKRMIVANLRKAAQQGALARAVARLLGVRGMTWDGLAEFGLVRGAGGTVSYDGGRSTPAAPAGAPPPRRSAPAARRGNGGQAPTVGTIPDVLRAPFQSVLRVDGVTLTGCRFGEKRADCTARLADTSMKLNVWGLAADMPSFVCDGAVVNLTAVRVGEYNNARQYNIDATMVEEAGGTST